MTLTMLLLLSLHFYPRPPRGGRRAARTTKRISKYFYPRPPRGGRRVMRINNSVRVKISIHALRGEGDPAVLTLLGGGNLYFYPRPPRGGRQSPAKSI